MIKKIYRWLFATAAVEKAPVDKIFRDHCVEKIETCFQEIQQKSFNLILLDAAKIKKDKRDAYDALQAEIDEFKIVLVNEAKNQTATVREARFALNSAERLQELFLRIFQPNVFDRKKIAVEFFKFTRHSRFSRMTKAAIATVFGFVGVVAATLLLALLTSATFFTILVPILGALVAIGIGATVYKLGKNDDEDRGHKLLSALNKVINDKNIENVIARIPNLPALLRPRASGLTGVQTPEPEGDAKAKQGLAKRMVKKVRKAMNVAANPGSAILDSGATSTAKMQLTMAQQTFSGQGAEPQSLVRTEPVPPSAPPIEVSAVGNPVDVAQFMGDDAKAVRQARWDEFRLRNNNR